MLEMKFVSEDEIIERLYKKLGEYIDRVVISSHIDGPLNQTQIAKFLTVSTDTILSYERLGMPYGHIGKRKFYDRKMCMDWQTSSKIDELI